MFDIDQIPELISRLTFEGNKKLQLHNQEIRRRERESVIEMFKNKGVSEKIINEVRDEFRKNKNISSRKKNSEDLDIRTS